MRVSKVALTLAASALVFGAASELSAGVMIEEKPAFAPTDSFLTKTIIVDYKFKTADGSVHPAGQYVLKGQGTGKAGEVAIIVQNPQGKTSARLRANTSRLRKAPSAPPRHRTRRRLASISLASRRRARFR